MKQSVAHTNKDSDTKNTLFPVFLKLNQFNLLIVGGGNAGTEKLSAILKNSPETKIRIVSRDFSDSIKRLVFDKKNIILSNKEYDKNDLDNVDLVIVAVNNIPLSEQICNDAHEKKLLVNVADKPELCDFYLSSIVQKGDLKIAISTNGKSPTLSKRLKEILHDAIPDEIDGVLSNMSIIRNKLNGDFSQKVKQLNELTALLVAKESDLSEWKVPKEKTWQKIVKQCLLAFAFLILGSAVVSFFIWHAVWDKIQEIPKSINTSLFLLMLLTGFLAQMVDGSLGMGYGTISTVFLLAIGVPPAVVSSRVHSARVFSSGVSGYSHHRFGNINKKLFKTLLYPGIIGCIFGVSAAYFSQKHPEISTWVRFGLTFYTAYLGYYIMRKAFTKKRKITKVKRAGWLAATGGFLDAFAGGGWGTLVTSTLVAKRRDTRYVIGSVCLTEFFVVFTGAITFFILLKNLPIIEILGLVLGGVIAAPIAARLVGKLPLRTMYIAVGSLVILTSIYTFWNVLHKLLS